MKFENQKSFRTVSFTLVFNKISVNGTARHEL